MDYCEIHNITCFTLCMYICTMYNVHVHVYVTMYAKNNHMSAKSILRYTVHI